MATSPAEVEDGGETRSPAEAGGGGGGQDDEARSLEEVVTEAMEDGEHQQEQQQQQHQPPPYESAAATDGLTRQSSLLSLTLDEIQNTVCEPGKNFGSMNMDEFLTNIWTAEEAVAGNGTTAGTDSGAAAAASVPDMQTAPPPSPGLCRQGSITLPPPLCRKTVEEVWFEINQQQQQQGLLEEDNINDDSQIQHLPAVGAGGAPRQPTFGEMTLEDFLIKAGVVRDAHPGAAAAAAAAAAAGYQPLLLTTNTPSAIPPPACLPQRAPLHLPPQPQGRHYAMPTPTYYADGTNNGAAAYHQQPVGYGANAAAADGYVGSPLSDDGFGGGQVLDGVSAGLAGGTGMWGSVEMAAAGASRGGGGGGGGARKRGLDHGVEGGPASSGGGGGPAGAAGGPIVEKVVERRQRRMIKNRESAARSRARKQAYTVELEAELNHLKEENARLLDEQRRMTAKRRQVLVESARDRPRIIYPAQKKTTAMRRCTSCRW